MFRLATFYVVSCILFSIVENIMKKAVVFGVLGVESDGCQPNFLFFSAHLTGSATLTSFYLPAAQFHNSFGHIPKVLRLLLHLSQSQSGSDLNFNLSLV